MKIVHLCLCSIINEDYAYQDNLLAKFHKKMGHDVTIIAPTYSKYDKNGKLIEEPAGRYIWENGVNVIRVKPILPAKVNRHLFLFHNIAPLLLSLQPDFIFVHCLLSLNYRSLLKIHEKMPKVRFAFDNHTDYINSNHNLLSTYYKKYVLKPFVAKPLQSLSDFFYGVTPSRCQFLEEEFGINKYKVKLLVMGADDDNMQLESRDTIRHEVRTKYKIEDNDFLIVTGGKIDKKKNIHTLLEAVKKINNQNAKVLFFGSISDDLKEYISSLISPNIIYLGWVKSDEVYKYFFAADLIVFPGLHSVLWEQALATQTPCAFSRLEGFEHVNYNNNCLFFESANLEEYKVKIQKLIDDKSLYKDLKENSKTEKSLQFMYSHIAKKVLDDAFPQEAN